MSSSIRSDSVHRSNSYRHRCSFRQQPIIEIFHIFIFVNNLIHTQLLSIFCFTSPLSNLRSPIKYLPPHSLQTHHFCISPNNQGSSSAHIPSQPANAYITTIKSTICGNFFLFLFHITTFNGKICGGEGKVHHRPPGKRISASTSASQGGLRCATNASLFLL
jgi:hypothetical protein